ncbi:NADP-specific glutamate dehydrogenase [Aestuariibacter sp. AA17]|uniref:Glutamate dehydrogenase n=1 Tax=Fluctibacter corallii TaxID=2984329 RepID=A0ABT3A569_9ALTE|nr:NADP-specific glutamate dehydrogenase [Aestuariibacter sp. AA17]MCV2883826.1 NADP-specific glutamate dehydrogenase [Aestuariibacter sp. AA17]
MTQDLSKYLDALQSRYKNQKEFLQAVEEVYQDIKPMIKDNKHYQEKRVFERLTEPDRIITFRVEWLDEDNQVHINRGWRVQHSNLIGPYKGGLRFHPTVNESILKFLAFEQCFKNALTGLPMGGGKGGADFDPKGKSDIDIMRFCQAYMMELQRHIGAKTDVPAGDINVGNREIGYLYGQYKKIQNQFEGVLTGKDIEFGGSHVRTEATGYGLVYFLIAMLEQHDKSLEGMRVAISGAGNVAIHAALKAIERGAKVISLSNSKGVLVCEEGFSEESVKKILARRGDSDNALKDVHEDINGKWQDDETPWHLTCDVAMPCATQNELNEDDAKSLIDNGCLCIAEGANMPCTSQAIELIQKEKVLYSPGKASNAGGVALSGLEMSQNASFQRKEFDVLNEQLREIMTTIHDRCVNYGEESDGHINYVKGANMASFERLANAMIALGI